MAGHYFQASFVSDHFVYWKGLGSAEKMKLLFLRLFDNPPWKYLTFKTIYWIQRLFWVFYQNYKEVWTSFCYTFSAWFFYKNVFYLVLNLCTRLQCHTFFPSEDIKQNVLLSSLFRQLVMSWTWRFNFDYPLKQWTTGRKTGKGKNTKNWISREWNKLFGWYKKQFS